MKPYPLGGTEDGASEFPLDRAVGFFFLGLFAARFALTAWITNVGWHRAGSIKLFDYLARSWWTHASYLAETAAEVWLGVGLVRGQRWGMVGLVLLYFAWLGTAVHGIAAYGLTDVELGYLLIDSLVLVYVAMRLTGSLGPKPKHPPKEADFYLPDRIAAYLDFALLAISVVLVVRSNAESYHRAQNMGSIGPPTYLASRWWTHTRWLFETFIEAWTILAIGRSRSWAFLLMALMSAGWFFHPLHTLNIFYIVSNGSMLLYCLVRLSGVLGPRPANEPAIVSG